MLIWVYPNLFDDVPEATLKIDIGDVFTNEDNLTPLVRRVGAVRSVDKLKDFLNALQHLHITIVKHQPALGAVYLEIDGNLLSRQLAIPEDGPQPAVDLFKLVRAERSHWDGDGRYRLRGESAMSTPCEAVLHVAKLTGSRWLWPFEAASAPSN